MTPATDCQAREGVVKRSLDVLIIGDHGAPAEGTPTGSSTYFVRGGSVSA
jgi:hypothetical protein